MQADWLQRGGKHGTAWDGGDGAGVLGGCGGVRVDVGAVAGSCGVLDPCALPLRTSLALRVIGPLSGAVRPATAESSTRLTIAFVICVCACSSQQHSFAAFSSSAATHTRPVRRAARPSGSPSAAAQRSGRLLPVPSLPSRSAACAVSACVSVCSASRCLSPA